MSEVWTDTPDDVSYRDAYEWQLVCPRCTTVIPQDEDGDPDGVQWTTTGRWYCCEPCIDADQREDEMWQRTRDEAYAAMESDR